MVKAHEQPRSKSMVFLRLENVFGRCSDTMMLHLTLIPTTGALATTSADSLDQYGMITALEIKEVSVQNLVSELHVHDCLRLSGSFVSSDQSAARTCPRYPQAIPVWIRRAAARLSLTLSEAQAERWDSIGLRMLGPPLRSFRLVT